MFSIQYVEPSSVERRLAPFISQTLTRAVGTQPLALAPGRFPMEMELTDPDYPRPNHGRTLLPLYLCDPDSQQAWAFYVFAPEQPAIEVPPTNSGLADQLMAQAHAMGIPARAQQWAVRTRPTNWLARLARYREQF